MSENRSTGSDLRWRPANLLLLAPLALLITAWYNRDEPALFGLPFFYWAQLGFVLVGVLSVLIVYLATKRDPHRMAPPPAPPASPDESGSGGGAAR